jgi:hypothetical protein
MTKRTSGRIAGIAFLAYIPVALASSAVFSKATRGSTMAETLASAAANVNAVRLATVLVFLSALCALVLAATLYGLTREVDRELAVFGLIGRAGEGILGVFQLTGFGIIWLATTTGPRAPDPQTAQSLASFLLAAGQWKANTCALLFALGSTGFALAFLRGRLLPPALAWLGVVASILLVAMLPIQMAGWIGGMSTYLLMWMPMLAFELWLAVYLIGWGIRPGSAGTAR